MRGWSNEHGSGSRYAAHAPACRAQPGSPGGGKAAILVALFAVTFAAGSGAGWTAGSPVHAAPPGAQEADPILIAAGDIASCSGEGDEATAALLDGLAGAVATLGDHAYQDGSPEEFASCFDPAWGRFRDRIHPAPGNHDYSTSDAAGYFGYFGAAAGDPAKGYYSYDLGTWHIVVLNSNCSRVGGCGHGTPQEEWLRDDLAAHPTICTLAYWHHPRFNSGAKYGNNEQMKPIWQALYDAGADVVLSAHEHIYERFAPQDPSGAPDPERGIRAFVVGTGGKDHYEFGTPLPTSEMRNNDAFGVLTLTLHPAEYEWQFVPVSGASFSDAGSSPCH